MNHATHALVTPVAGEVELTELPVPDPGRGEVVVRSEYSGISTGTDRWLIQGKFDWGPQPFPAVPGYQKSGYVVAAGEGAEEWIDRPVVATRARDFSGANARSGSHSHYSTHQIDYVYELAGSPTPELALAVSAQVGYNAAHRIDISRAARVAVIGDGIIGLSGALSAINRGLKVWIVGRHADRLNIAQGAGATAVRSGPDALAAVRDFCPDAVIDTIQSDDSFEIVIGSLPADTGQVVYSGYSPGTPRAWASMTRLQQRALTAHFVSGWNRPRMVAVIREIESGTFGLERLQVQVIPAVRGAEALTNLARNGPAPLASVIRWEERL